jgi:hypothetical protein
MSDATAPEPNTSHTDEAAALFASLVIQQANMATMLMGKAAHAEGGKPIKDLEAARLFIDYLEMLEVKTKGNLSREESALLKQTLMSLRLAFVEAVETPSSEAPSKAPGEAPPAQATAAGTDGSRSAETSAETGAEESRKKFSKKY